jgi:hypothetical protein
MFTASGLGEQLVGWIDQDGPVFGSAGCAMQLHVAAKSEARYMAAAIQKRGGLAGGVNDGAGKYAALFHWP